MPAMLSALMLSTAPQGADLTVSCDGVSESAQAETPLQPDDILGHVAGPGLADQRDVPAAGWV